MTDDRSSIERLLNQETPHRPTSDEEVMERIAAAPPLPGRQPVNTTEAEQAVETAASPSTSPAEQEAESPPSDSPLPPPARQGAAPESRNSPQVDQAERELAEMLGKAEAMMRSMTNSLAAASGPVETSDEFGAVTVQVEGGRKRVTGIRVATDWQRRVAPEALGVAVLQALTTAQLGSLGDFFGAASAAPQATPLPAKPPERGGQAPDWDQLGHMFETVDRALDALVGGPPDLAALGITEQHLGTTTGRSANGQVEVVFTSGLATAVNVDANWAVRTNRQQLADSLLEAFEDGQDRAPEGAAPAAGGLLGELQNILWSFGVESNAWNDQGREGRR